MQSAEDQLLPNESVQYRTNPHWMIFIMPVIIMLLGVFLTFINPLLNIVAYLMFAAGALSFLMSAITFKFTEYVITNLRFIKKFGFISRKTNGVPKDKIESVDTEQTVFGRMLGFGSVIITGTGGTREIVFNIPEPFEFRTKLQQSINQ